MTSTANSGLPAPPPAATEAPPPADVPLRLVAADEDRFRELFENHVRELLGYALRRSGSPDDAADVLAETMLVAWRRFDRVPTDGTARLWLYLGARVTGAVGCAWLNQWISANDAGDQAKKQEAVTAMQGSHSWKVLSEMAKQGAWPSVFWQLADMIAKNQDPSMEKSGIGCS